MGGIGVFVGNIVPVGTGVAVGGIGVLVGITVLVGTGVAVGTNSITSKVKLPYAELLQLSQIM